MISPRLAVVPVVLLATVLSLSGCGFLEPVPTSTPSPSASAIDTTKYLGGVIDPADTTWSGKDSGGDQTTITLHADGTVAISYGANSYDYPGDTWSVRDGILHVEVYLDEINGSALYTGTWNPETSTLDTVMITTRTAKTLDVTLAQQ